MFESAAGEIFCPSCMANILIIQQIVGDSRVEAGRLEGDDVYVGREPGEGLALKSQGISRRHGVFTLVRSHWFYRDLGSTNGSWLNGVKLERNEWKLIKHRDFLQLADVALQVVESAESGRGGRGFPALAVRSLLVFARGEFLDEYPIPEYGRALVIGGSKADLKLDVDIYDLPSLVVERRGDNICAFTIARDVAAFHNSQEMTHAVILSDRDELRIAHYLVIFNDAPLGAVPDVRRAAHAALEAEGQPAAYYQAEGLESEAESSARQRRLSERLPFGKTVLEPGPEVGETVAIDPGNMQGGFDRHPAMRYAAPEDISKPLGLQALEDKIVLGIGMVMLLVLFALVAWWVLT